MVELSQEGDRVVLAFGDERRAVLLSLEIARHASRGLNEMARKAIASKEEGRRDREPSVFVEAIVNGHVPQVRLRFGWWATRMYFTPLHAMNLAALIRAAHDKAESELRWLEEREPAELLR